MKLAVMNAEFQLSPEYEEDQQNPTDAREMFFRFPPLHAAR